MGVTLFIVDFMNRCYKGAQAREQHKNEIDVEKNEKNYKGLDIQPHTARYIAMYSSLCEENKDVEIDPTDIFLY